MTFKQYLTYTQTLVRQEFFHFGDPMMGTLTAFVVVVVVFQVEHGDAVLAVRVNEESEVDLEKKNTDVRDNPS